MKGGKTPKERCSEELLTFIMMFIFIFPFVLQANIL